MMKMQFDRGAAGKIQFDEGAAKKKIENLCKPLRGIDKRDAKLLVETLFDPSAPTYRFSLRKGSDCPGIPRGLMDRYGFFNIAKELREILKERGYREPFKIWTGQEHRIIESSYLMSEGNMCRLLFLNTASRLKK